MWPNPQFPADLVTFTEEILNGKLHFLYSENTLSSNFYIVLFENHQHQKMVCLSSPFASFKKLVSFILFFLIFPRNFRKTFFTITLLGQQ